MKNQNIVLRKIGGVFDACRAIAGMPNQYTPPSRASGSAFSVGGIARMLFVVMLIVTAVVALAHAPLALAGVGVMGIKHDDDDDDRRPSDSVATLVNKLNRAYNDMKEANDERFKKLEAREPVDILVTNKVEAANKAITDLSDDLKLVQKAMKDLETANARYVEHGSPEAFAKERANARAFFSLVRNASVENVSDNDMDAYRAYKKGLNAYFRMGAAALNDSNIRNALSTGAATQGGFWVLPDTSGRIVELIYQTSPVRQVASQQTIGTDALEGWKDLDQADSGWVGESQARPETNTPVPSGKWSIPMHEQYANPKITQKMLDDTFYDVEGWLTKKVAAFLARGENTAFVTGDGILRPKGFACTAYTTAAQLSTKQTATAFNFYSYVKSGANGDFLTPTSTVNPGDRIIDLIALLKTELRAGASFACNSNTVAGLRKLKDGQGNYLMIPGFQNAFTTGVNLGVANAGGLTTAGQLQGFPLIEFQDLPDYTTNGNFALFFANWREAYQIIDHAAGLRVLRDPYTGKPYVSYYTTKRTGGDIVNWEAIKAMKFTA